VDNEVKASYSWPMRILPLLMVVALLGCKSNSDAPASAPQKAEGKSADPALDKEAADAAYSRDIDSLCNAEERSGALEEDESARALHVAAWLGRTIKTQGGRDFLAKFSQAPPDQKGSLLTAEAQKLGIKECPTAGAWGGGHSRLPQE
jgi:hypothetical protein